MDNKNISNVYYDDDDNCVDCIHSSLLQLQQYRARLRCFRFDRFIEIHRYFADARQCKECIHANFNNNQKIRYDTRTN